MTGSAPRTHGWQEQLMPWTLQGTPCTGGLLATSVVWRGRLVVGRKSWEKLFGEGGGIFTLFSWTSGDSGPQLPL